MGRGIAEVGVPGVVAAALREYARRRRELELAGLTRDRADAQILSEARATAGVFATGARIDLSSWSQRTDVPLAVLEALVVSIEQAERRPLPPAPVAPPAPEIAYFEDPSLAEPMTPAPMAMRVPRFDLPELFELVPAQGGAHPDHAHFLARFRFPDPAAMARCFAPLALSAAPGVQEIVLDGVTVRARVLPLALELRLEPEGTLGISNRDSARARVAGRALAVLDLRAYRRAQNG